MNFNRQYISFIKCGTWKIVNIQQIQYYKIKNVNKLGLNVNKIN